jgi:hypothetical protein
VAFAPTFFQIRTSLQQVIWYKNFGLFIGVPVLTFVAVVLGIILGSSLACLAISKISISFSPWTVLASVAYFLLLSRHGQSFLDNHYSPEASTRMFWAMVTLIPVGFLISFPFPLLIRELNIGEIKWGALGYCMNSLLMIIFYGLGIHLAINYGFSSLNWIIVAI